MSEPQQVTAAKPFAISKRVVFEAWEKVKSNRGAAGVDGQSIADFEADLRGNLYRIWNRMSSGSYFPFPVRAVEIPKAGGVGVRVLGVPTVSDRVAQTVVRLYLEPEVEPLSHPDSYGYRPGRSALDAVGACRKRCWSSDWVIDLDIRAFFDSLDHDLVLRSVEKHTDLAWVLLYVRRWLTAPLQRSDGTLVARDRGTPQGSAISPLLANLFLHYAFDRWLAREFPTVSFERYADDAVIHCVSKGQAQHVLGRLVERMAQVGLELHSDKTRIVYCKDSNRGRSHEHEWFTFLGYTFGPRRAAGAHGHFVSFSPAVSNPATKAIRAKIKAWRLHQRSESSLSQLADAINSIVTGWVTYYGRFYRSRLYPSLRHINDYLLRWAMQKYKRLENRRTRARAWLKTIAGRQPQLFVHWRLGLVP
ncbi:MAG: group II intron reverse transcriptase/maturase [Acidimicrobiales bacterium]